MTDARAREGVAPAPRQVTFATDAPTPFVSYAASLVEQTAGVRLVRPDSDEAPVDIYHGNDERRPCRFRIPSVPSYTTVTVPGLPERRQDALRGSTFPYDVFAATRFWLADEAHAARPDGDFDEHGRLRPEASAHAARGLVDVPVVNAYLLELRSWIAGRLGVVAEARHLRPGKRCAVVLSHDVDSPIDPGAPGHAVRLALGNLRRGRMVGASVSYGAGAVWYSAASRMRDPGARHFLFEEIVRAEQERGFRSTFFFAPTSRFSRAGCRRDVGYDVARPPVPRVLRWLAAQGCEIGLHVGYLAGDDARRMAAERSRLEEVAGVDVVTSRHHYFRLTRPLWSSLAAHGEAGLKIDSSVSFNSVPGYRLGVALPFRPWDPRRAEPVSTVQVPTLLMDSMLFSERDRSVDGAVARVRGLLAGLKEYEGVAAIDWHEYTSFPGSKRYGDWGKTYLAILDLLAADREVDVRTYSEVADSQVAH